MPDTTPLRDAITRSEAIQARLLQMITRLDEHRKAAIGPPGEHRHHVGVFACEMLGALETLRSDLRGLREAPILTEQEQAALTEMEHQFDRLQAQLDTL
jgi:hypothetical protein